MALEQGALDVGGVGVDVADGAGVGSAGVVVGIDVGGTDVDVGMNDAGVGVVGAGVAAGAGVIVGAGVVAVMGVAVGTGVAAAAVVMASAGVAAGAGVAIGAGVGEHAARSEGDTTNIAANSARLVVILIARLDIVRCSPALG